MKLIAAIILLALIPHEYHLSIHEIDINDGRIEITQKLFADDFEMAFHKMGMELSIGDDLGEEDVSSAMQTYVQDHFELIADQKKVELIFIGAEWDSDLHTIYLYWEGEINSATDQLEVRNTIFQEVSQEQENMHHLLWDSQKHSFVLKQDNVIAKLRKDK